MVSVMSLMSVDFPHPFSPTTPTRSPMWMVRSRSVNTGGIGGTFLPFGTGYEKETFSKEIKGPGNRRSGASGSRIETPFSSTGTSIAALAVR